MWKFVLAVSGGLDATACKGHLETRLCLKTKRLKGFPSGTPDSVICGGKPTWQSEVELRRLQPIF
jgi:hypothetical protein